MDPIYSDPASPAIASILLIPEDIDDSEMILKNPILPVLTIL